MLKIPKIRKEKLKLAKHSGYASDKAYEENMQKIAKANYETQVDALQKTLDVMWKTMLLAMVSVVLSAIAVLVAVLK